VTLGDAHRSSACPVDGIACWSTPLTVRQIALVVSDALHAVSGRAPEERCFRHNVGDSTAGTSAESCVVDVHVGGSVAYAYVDPGMTGLAGQPVGATVALNAD
jgi:hypothetical protein